MGYDTIQSLITAVGNQHDLLDEEHRVNVLTADGLHDDPIMVDVDQID